MLSLGYFFWLFSCFLNIKFFLKNEQKRYYKKKRQESKIRELGEEEVLGRKDFYNIDMKEEREMPVAKHHEMSLLSILDKLDSQIGEINYCPIYKSIGPNLNSITLKKENGDGSFTRIKVTARRRKNKKCNKTVVMVLEDDFEEQKNHANMLVKYAEKPLFFPDQCPNRRIFADK